jgi:hypothetical protein
MNSQDKNFKKNLEAMKNTGRMIGVAMPGVRPSTVSRNKGEANVLSDQNADKGIILI